MIRILITEAIALLITLLLSNLFIEVFTVPDWLEATIVAAMVLLLFALPVTGLICVWI